MLQDGRAFLGVAGQTPCPSRIPGNDLLLVTHCCWTECLQQARLQMILAVNTNHIVALHQPHGSGTFSFLAILSTVGVPWNCPYQ